MKKCIILILLVFYTLYAFSQVNETYETGKHQSKLKSSNTVIYNPKMDAYNVVYYGLNIEASNLTSTISSGRVIIKAKAENAPLTEFVIQLINELTVSQVKIDGQVVTFSHVNNEISFTCPIPIPVGELFTVEVEYSGIPVGAGWSNTVASNWNMSVTWTLSESFHAYEWFPVKQSLTDKADSADIYVTVPSNLKVASNGLLKNVADVGGGKKRFEWQCRYPIDYYLISVTISDYIEYNIYANPTGLGKPLLIQNFVYNVSSCLDIYKNAIDGTPAIIELYSNLFGMYPFSNEKYGHVMAPFGGGMEHQTMTTVGSFSNGLIAHELAHMWFGDYVTCKTWQDIWINEGFASYAEYINLQNLNSQANADLWMESAHYRAKLKPNGSVYLGIAESTDENRIFSTELSYKKGACIIHILRYEINNDSLFYSILKQFLNRFGHSTATGEDFKTVVNELTGQDYTWFFDQWYYGYGFPEFTIKYGYTGSQSWVAISQIPSNLSTPLFKTSMDLVLKFNDQTTSTQRIFISENPQIFTFDTPKIQSLQVDPLSWLLCKFGSIESNDADSWVTIDQNPFSNKIQFTILQDYQSIKVSITDITGKVLYNLSFNSQFFEIDTSKLPKGTYIIKVSDGNRYAVKKIVKG
ncbi:MAG: T9SS type A sorting domain-containing protein [Bacteroidales bacterium]|nr:T9SS type A sorting domain-containing protein [Bacteroidales bacterium]